MFLKNMKKEKNLTLFTFHLTLMVFCQELSNSVRRNCKGDSCSHFQCIYANHITILEREAINNQVMQIEQVKE